MGLASQVYVSYYGFAIDKLETQEKENVIKMKLSITRQINSKSN